MDKNILSLKDKVALVTGARRGIGRAIAFAFADAGANVAICDCITDDSLLDQVALQINNLGRDFLAICADTSKKADVDAMMAQVMNKFGKIDILVNNAGIIIRDPILDVPENDWDSIMNIDLKGYFLCAQAAGRHMVAQGSGSIINIATQWAFKTTPGMGVYSIAKAGVVMLTRVLARELGPDVRANAIAPGLVKTDFSSPWKNPEMLRQIEENLPMKRIAEPEDLVNYAVFLASPVSSYMTGNVIVLDGGSLT